MKYRKLNDLAQLADLQACAEQGCKVAARKLIHHYLHEKNVVAVFAWRMMALCNGSNRDENLFLNKNHGVFTVCSRLPEKYQRTSENKPITHDFSINTLKVCAFLSALLAGHQFKDIPQSKWLRKWHPHEIELFVAANAQSDAISHLTTKESFHDNAIGAIAYYAMAKAPYLFFDYFSYCHKRKIIPNEAYYAVMKLMLNYSHILFDPAIKIELTDKINLALAQFYSNREDWGNTRIHQQRLSRPLQTLGAGSTDIPTISGYHSAFFRVANKGNKTLEGINLKEIDQIVIPLKM